MIDHDHLEPGDRGEWTDLEHMIRDAGAYVRASDDLRPRTLETAKLELVERTRRGQLHRLAVLVGMVALLTAPLRGGLLTDARPARGVTSDDLYAQAVAKSAYSGSQDHVWLLVDAFCEFRARQSAAFRKSIN